MHVQEFESLQLRTCVTLELRIEILESLELYVTKILTLNTARIFLLLSFGSIVVIRYFKIEIT